MVPLNKNPLKRIFLFFAVFVIFFNLHGTAETVMCRVPLDRFQEASGNILAGEYRKAEEVFNRYIESFPEEPAGHLMKAAVLQYHCIDYNDFSREEEFFQLLNSAEMLAGKKIEANENDIWAHFFLYSAKTLRAVWEVTMGNFIIGIIKGQSGIRGMSRIISEDGDFYDGYLTIGSYRFWKSVAIRPIYWLPFIEDQRKQGITEVENAIAKGKLISPLSSIVLIEMLIVYDLEHAVEYTEALAGQYPSCRLFKWQLGESLKKAGRYEAAVSVLTDLAEEIYGDPEDDGSGPLRCWWKLAVLSESLGKYKECRHYCEEILRIGQKKSVYERQKKRIDGAGKLLERISNE